MCGRDIQLCINALQSNQPLLTVGLQSNFCGRVTFISLSPAFSSPLNLFPMFWFLVCFFLFVCLILFGLCLCFMSWYFIGALTLRVIKQTYTYFANEETGVEKLKTQDTEKNTFRINNGIKKYMASSSYSACCETNVFIKVLKVNRKSQMINLTDE